MSEPLKSTSYKSTHSADPDLPGPVNALRKADSLKREVEEALRPWDLTWPQLDTLVALRELGPMRIREAIEKLGSGVPRRIDARGSGGLADMGYVEKRSDPSHPQAKHIVLTDEGEEALSQALLALENLSVAPQPAEIREAA